MIQAAARLLTRYRHVNWALADQAMVSGANFLTWVALARALGIEEFGRFALVWMVVLFVDGIQHSAISAPMISIGPKQNETERPSYYGAVFLHQAMFAAASATVVFGAIHLCAAIFPKWDLRSLAAPLSFVVLAGQSQDFLRRYFFTLGRPAIAFLIDGFRYLGQIAALYWIFFHLSLDSNGAGVALWTMATTSFVAVISASGKSVV